MDKKVVVITGASSGIGRETALYLAKNGYTVYGVARRAEKLKELEPLGVKTVPADVTDEASVANGIREVIENEGRIDVLINNAGYGEWGAVEDVTIENAQKQFDVNVFGLARMTRLVLPCMRAQKSGKIVNISSIGGKMASPMGGWYYASKFAVEALSDSLRLEVKPFGVDVILIEPGLIKSEWGAIAMNTMFEASKNTVYNRLAQGAKKTVDVKGTKPIAIAKVIKKAIEARKPKARYVKGYMAKPILFFKRYLSDALFDKIMASQF
jgi:short-subunit dehydrogenase